MGQGKIIWDNSISEELHVCKWLLSNPSHKRIDITLYVGEISCGAHRASIGRFLVQVGWSYIQCLPPPPAHGLVYRCCNHRVSLFGFHCRRRAAHIPLLRFQMPSTTDAFEESDPLPHHPPEKRPTFACHIWYILYTLKANILIHCDIWWQNWLRNGPPRRHAI